MKDNIVDFNCHVMELVVTILFLGTFHVTNYLIHLILLKLQVLIFLDFFLPSEIKLKMISHLAFLSNKTTKRVVLQTSLKLHFFFLFAKSELSFHLRIRSYF